MGSEWKETTLGELVDFTPKRTIKKGSIAPFVAMADLRENHREILCVTEKEYKGGGSRFANGDTLFARITPCLENGKTALAKNLPDGFIAHGSTEFIIMAARLSEYDREFIYYLARHPDFRKFAESRMEGTSGRQRVSWQSLSDYPISLPSPSERKAIAHILSSLDDKIELNRRMNATLEGMAQALFKSWFVDFDPVIDNALAAGNPIPDELAPRAEVRRQALASSGELGRTNVTTQQGSVDHPTLSDSKTLFPNSFQFTEELGWIPEGWEARAIGDSFQLLGGHSFKSGDYVEDGQFGIVTIKNVQDGNFVQECSNSITEVPAKMKSHCYLKSGDVLLSLTGNVGRACVVSEGDYLLNQRVSKIVGRDGIPDAFGYFFFRQESLYERMITIAKGTAQQNLSPIETAKLEQVMPSNQTIAELGHHLREFHAKMVGITTQSQTLTKLRDTLLPKLISGELRVEETSNLKEKAAV